MKILSLVMLMMVLLWGINMGYCFQNRSVDLRVMKYFSVDYEEARTKFLDASRIAGADIVSYKNKHQGPEGESLFTDVALIGPSDAHTIIVIGSGTHGVEGFAGSAIQTGLLLDGVFSAVKPGLRIILIHAINPYGFAHLRRFNEENVDVNRNFFDHLTSFPANTGYEDLAGAIAPDSISFPANVKSIFKLFRYGLINRKTDLKNAISAGQHTHPKGLFYGGRNETWSNKTLKAICRRYLSNAKQVVYIGVHTGLGPYGKAEIILNEKKDSPSYKRALDWWGNIVQTTVHGDSVSVHLQTSLKLALSRILPGIEVTAVSLEFGTIPALKVFWALRAENWLYHYGRVYHPKAINIKMRLLRVFYPDDDAWKSQVWEQGREVVTRVLQQLH